jgi:O-antigen/teichoic acid export membrane protein
MAPLTAPASPTESAEVEAELLAPAPPPAGVRSIADVRALITATRLRLAGDGMAGTVARGAIWSFLINVAGTAAAFAVQVLLARAIDAEEYGRYLYVLAWMNVALLLGKLEFENSTVRFVGAYVGTGQWSLLRGFLRRSHQIVAVASFGASLVMLAAAWLFRARLGTALMPAFGMAALLLPLQALILVQTGSLQGFKRVVAAQAPNLLARPLLFGAGIALAVYLAGHRLAATGALVLQILASAATVLIGAAALQRAVPLPVAEHPAAFRTGYWLQAVVGLLLISVSNLVIGSQMDVLIVGTMLGTTDAGVYGAASQLTNLIGFGATAIAFIMTPLMAELHARGSTRDLQRLISLGMRANLAITLPAIPLLALFGRFLLGLFGAEFVSGYAVLLVLAIGRGIVTPLLALSGYVMTMTGQQNEAGIISLGTAVLNIVLALVLTPRLGALGTALATSLTAIARAVAFGVYIRRRLGVSMLSVRGAP